MKIHLSTMTPKTFLMRTMKKKCLTIICKLYQTKLSNNRLLRKKHRKSIPKSWLTDKRNFRHPNRVREPKKPNLVYSIDSETCSVALKIHPMIQIRLPSKREIYKSRILLKMRRPLGCTSFKFAKWNGSMRRWICTEITKTKSQKI